MPFDPKLIAGAMLGWSLGANDAANVFGTAVASKMVRWITAAILLAVFVFLGSVIQGHGGLETYSALADQTARSALYVSLSAALSTIAMTLAKLPISTSQAVVGGIMGVAVFAGAPPELESLKKIVACWIGTPIGAAVFALFLYPVLAACIRRINLHFLTYDHLMRYLLVAAGIYSAYSLGANNAANVVGAFYGAGAFGTHGSVAARFAALAFGGLSIAVGALTYSRPIMMTVGRGIVKLDAFSAFVVVLAHGVTIHLFAMIGVPVSSSQAVVGAVAGIGLYKGMKTIRHGMLVKIGAGWFATPLLGFAFSWCMMFLWGPEA